MSVVVQPRTKKIVSIALRTVVCVAAMYFVLRSVSLSDRATLVDGRQVTVTNWLAVSQAHPDLADPAITFDTSVGRVPLSEIARRDDASLAVEVGLVSASQSCDWRTLTVALLLFAPVALLQSVRFTWMVRAQDIELSYWEGIKLSYAGNFLNFVALGSTGGDIFKAYYVSCHTDRKTEAVTTVLLDRAVGLISLILIALFTILLKFGDPRIREWALPVGLLGAGLAVGVVVVFSRRIRSIIRIDALLERLPFSNQLQRIDAATLRMRDHKKLVLSAVLITIVLQFFAISSMILFGIGVGMSDGASYYPGYYVYIALALLVAAVPITWQGVGTMDGVLQIFFLGAYGSYSQILLLGLGIRLLQLFWSLPGFLVPITGAHRPSSQKIEQLQALATGSES